MRSSSRLTTIAAAFACSIVLPLRAQGPAVELPLLDLPYNVSHGGLRAPGMQQSLGVTAGFYDAAHGLLARVAPAHPRLRNVGVTIFDYFTLAVPFGDAWLHEEWHRAVLGQHGIDSRDEVWNLRNVFADAISVSHVGDEDLSRLKRESPASFVRMKAAGYEGENELLNRLETNQFFTRSRAWHVGLYWLVALNDQLYVGTVTAPEDSAEIDRITMDANRDETTIAQRDVSGHDFTAWVYHLFRSAEPFEARGPHPSGVGIDRYVKVADLSPAEKRFLEREGKLAWLNFVDPNFIGIASFDVRNPLNGQPARANAWLRHSLTSFGHSIDAHVVAQQGSVGVHATLQRFTNHDRSFPGVRMELVDYPVRAGGGHLLISPRVGAWTQPHDQQFMTRDADLGGLAGLRVATTSRSVLSFFADAEIKTRGWVAGRPNLGAGATFQTGIKLALTHQDR